MCEFESRVHQYLVSPERERGISKERTLICKELRECKVDIPRTAMTINNKMNKDYYDLIYLRKHSKTLYMDFFRWM